MFDKFSANLFTAIALAQREAVKAACAEVSPNHLLIGLRGLANDKAAELLRAAGILESKGGQPELSEPLKDIPLSTEAKRTLEAAWQIARQNNEPECGTLHLLAALQQLDTNGQLSSLDVASILGKPSNSDFSEPSSLNAQALREKIQIWQNRAEMAKKQGNLDLVEQALIQKRKYEDLLARSQD